MQRLLRGKCFPHLPSGQFVNIFCSDHASRIREHEDTKLTNKTPRWTESLEAEIRGAYTDLENHKDAAGMCHNVT